MLVTWTLHLPVVPFVPDSARCQPGDWHESFDFIFIYYTS